MTGSPARQPHPPHDERDHDQQDGHRNQETQVDSATGVPVDQDPDDQVDDPLGVTAAFNRNVLAVLNTRLGADFHPERFEHVARWNESAERIEMWLRATEAQTVHVADLDLRVAFAAGEELRTETSAKFRRPGVEAELAAAGFGLDAWWTDAAGDFALSLSFVR